MIKTLVTASVIAFAATTAHADTKTVYYPEKACAQILSQEYSTGGGDTAFQYLEILCVDTNGHYHGFVASWVSVGGIFGVGRITMPDTFDYQPYNGNTLEIK